MFIEGGKVGQIQNVLPKVLLFDQLSDSLKLTIADL